MNSLIKKTFSLSLLAAISSISHAIEPRSFELGYFDVVPTLALGASRNDNIFQTSESKVDTTIWTVTPSVQAILQGDNNFYTLQADLFNGTYADSPEDDYTDWRIGAAAQRQLTSRASINLEASLFSTHESRGTGFSEGGNIPDEAADYKIETYGLGYGYGNLESKGRLRLDFSYSSKKYDIPSASIPVLARDNDNLGIETTFTLSALQNSDFLFQYRYRDINYELDEVETQGSQDSVERYALVGVQWESGSTLSGSVMVGLGEKEYASSLRENESTPSWDLDILWAPYSYSNFSFGANKSFTEANATGNSITSQSYMFGWSHSWSERFGTSLNITRRDASVGGINRRDKTNTTSIGFNYAFRRWMDISFSFTNNVADSNDALFNYTQRITSLSIQASM